MKTQKKSYSLILFSLFLFLFSCNKDDEPGTFEMVCGEWTIESVTTEITINSSSLVQFFVEALALSEEDAHTIADDYYNSVYEYYDGTMEFKSDGTYEFNLQGGTETTAGDWNLHPADEKALSISYANGVYNFFRIRSLTDAEFVYGVTETSIYYIDNDYLRDTLIYELEITLAK